MDTIPASDAAPTDGLAGRIEARRAAQAMDAARKAAVTAEEARKAAEARADEATKMPKCVAVVERMTPALTAFFKECAKSPDFAALFGSEPGAHARSARYGVRLDLMQEGKRQLALSDYRPCAMLVMGEGANQMLFLATEVKPDGSCMMAVGLFRAREPDSKRNPFVSLIDRDDKIMGSLGCSMMSEFVLRVSPGGEKEFFDAAADSMAEDFTSGRIGRLARTRVDGENWLGRETVQAWGNNLFVYVPKLNGLCSVYEKPEGAVADKDGKFPFDLVGFIGEDDLAAAKARGETPPPVLNADNVGESGLALHGIGNMRRRLAELGAVPAPEPAPGA